MKLLIIRHGIAEDYSKDGRDESRALTQEGIHKFAKVAKFLSEKISEKSALLFVSPYLRAQQTADILSKYICVTDRFESENFIPEGDIEEAFQEISKSECDLIVCVGHQPHLGSFVAYAVTGGFQPIVSVGRGSATLIEFQGGIRKGGGMIRFVVSPKVI